MKWRFIVRVPVVQETAKSSGGIVVFISNNNLLRAWPCFLLVFLFLTGGCGFYDDSETIGEEQERAYQRGKQLLREGRQDDALDSFLRVIQRRPSDAPESHLEAAAIYLNHRDDPVEAIHHFRRYLEQKPHSPQAELVEGQINRAMKELARTLPGKPLQHAMERLDLLETVDELESENRRLRTEVASLREAQQRLTVRLEEAERRSEELQVAQRTPDSPVRQQQHETVASTRTPEPQQPRQASSSSGTRTYIVEPGDSLYGISREVYGTGSRWREIFEANSDILSDENSVRVGMRLEIPAD